MQVPRLHRVKSFAQDTHDVFTLSLVPENGKQLAFLPGQFNMLYLFGIGEVAISISGDPNQRDELIHTIRAVGAVTQGLQRLKKDEEIGVRGPFGTHWPLEKNACDMLVIAGGLGFAPLRPALFHLAENRHQYKKMTLLYGTRTPEDILYKNDMQKWKSKGIDVEVTVDYADINWRGQVGVVTTLIRKHLPNPQNTLVLLCGPEIMIKFALIELTRANVSEDNIYLSLERNMQCAVGFCGHCQYGPYFLCKDGPIFSYAQIKNLLPIKEL